MSPRAACLTCWITIVTVVLNSSVCPAQNTGGKPLVVSPESVQKSIDRSVNFLLSSQKDDGGWDDVNDYPGGVTSLVVLALLTAGLPPDHPKVANALNYSRQRVPKKTYTVALQSMAFCAANPTKFAADIQRNTEWLVKAQCKDGSWSYGEDGASNGDPSNTQFALLALYEAQRAGAQLPPEVWKSVYGLSKKYWLAIRNKDGSFPYNPGSAEVRGSMTCAGVSSLVIVGSQLDGSESSVDGEIQCCGKDSSSDYEINAALKWLTTNFTVHSNPGSQRQFHLYYLYGLERAGRMTGQRFLGDHDWYREGCEALMRIQEDVSGKFDSAHQTNLGNDYTETAFGLLFLAKGKRQVVINRLKFGKGDDWNHHSMAMQHLTSHTERAWKRDLAWQTIDLQKAKIADLLEAPVLFISASNAPVLTNESRELLREYVEQQGGFIFAEACNGDGCDGEAFDDYMRRFAAEVLGKPLEKLSPDHPIWHAERSVDLKAMPKDFWLYGVQTCCRLGLVYSPISLSCRWELNSPYGARTDYKPAIQAELDNATLTGINVLSYATGKELKQKLQSILVLEEVKNMTPTDRGVFVLPQLQHNAAADDAPRAITNLIEWMGKENPFRMSSEHRMVPIADEELQKYPMVFMHGRGELKFNESQRSTLRNYIKNGGFIFADAICADEQFAASFRREMAVILNAELQPINEGHPLLLGNRFSGYDIRQVNIIDPQRTKDQIAVNRRRVSPQLEIANSEDRVVVVFSPLDMSCALESRHSLQCRGYTRDDAARIGINVILFGLQQ